MAPFDNHFGPVLLVLAEFAFLLALGFIFMRLLHWHAILENNRDQWLQACQLGARQLRVLRRQLQKLDGDWEALPLPSRWRKKLNVILWAGKAFKVARNARS